MDYASSFHSAPSTWSLCGARPGLAKINSLQIKPTNSIFMNRSVARRLETNCLQCLVSVGETEV